MAATFWADYLTLFRDLSEPGVESVARKAGKDQIGVTISMNFWTHRDGYPQNFLDCALLIKNSLIFGISCC
jgi:hypothetical protein